MPAPGPVQQHRAALRAAGGFAEECRHQAAVVAQADARDRYLATFMDAALEDVERSDE